MSKRGSIPKVNKEKLSAGSKLVDIDTEALTIGIKRPSLAITYMDLEKSYGLKDLHSKAKEQGGNRKIYKELVYCTDDIYYNHQHFSW